MTKYAGAWPPYSCIKLVDYGLFCVLVDPKGMIDSCGYCAAQDELKCSGYEFETKGEEYGQRFEIWRFPQRPS